MANSLHQDVEPGELVVLDKKGLKPEYHALEQRIEVARGGFGLQADTTGRAFYAQSLFDRLESDIRFCPISKVETDALKAQLMALELWRPENVAALLELTDFAEWAKDVIHACVIWYDQAYIDQPPSLSNR